MRSACAVAAAALVMSGCGGAAPRQDAAGDEGISAKEAKRHGVFVNDFDAKLTGTGTRLTLRNVGHKTDTYSISLAPRSAGTVTPRTATLRAGRRMSVTVKLAGKGSVRVFSQGRGAEIADAPVG